MHRMHKSTPPNRLREVRTHRGVKLITIAAACDVDTTTVARWQNKGIPADHLPTVAETLNVNVPYLTGWSSTDGPYVPPVAA